MHRLVPYRSVLPTDVPPRVRSAAVQADRRVPPGGQRQLGRNLVRRSAPAWVVGPIADRTFPGGAAPLAEVVAVGAARGLWEHHQPRATTG